MNKDSVRATDTLVALVDAAECSFDDVRTAASVACVAHDREALLILASVDNGQILMTVPVTKGIQTQVATEGSGFKLEIHCAEQLCSVNFQNVEALHHLLLPLKQYAAWAEEQDFRADGRSHRWISFYQPADASVGKRVPKTESRQRSATDASESSIASSSVIDSILSNPFFTKLEQNSPSSSPSSVSSVDRVQRIKDRFLADALAKRRKEFVETQDLLVRCTTWNMAGTELIESLKPMLNDKTPGDVKFHALAFQEMDLSRQAYLSTSQAKADLYRERIESALGDYYELICSHQLVGILLCVYAHKSIVPAISEVEKSAVPTGFANLLGNKGAVGIRFKVFNSCFAFVNCHLAAGQTSPDKRNSDIEDITKRMFNEGGVWDNGLDSADTVFCMGDLNYRVDLSYAEAHEALEKRNIRELLANDQLMSEVQNQRAFQGFKEAEINFLPTYKFDIGTDDYDTSEKQRVPSFTDRVLVRSVLPMEILAKHYRSWPEYMQSDHKPVSAVIRAAFETILTDKLDTVRQETLRDLDRHENAAIPVLTVSEHELDFGDIRYQRPVTRSFVIHNEGAVASRFRFINRDDDTKPPCPRWCWPLPRSGSLEPGESMTLQVTICPDAMDALSLNQQKSPPSNILVIATERGRDAFLSVKGNWHRSCCGQSLKTLSRRQNTADDEEAESTVPKEIFLLCDAITASCDEIELKQILMTTSSGTELDALQDVLEENLESIRSLPAKTTPAAAMTLLMEMLSTLEEPLIPCDRYQDALAHSASSQLAIDFLDTLPSLQANVLIYLIAFLRSLLESHRGTLPPPLSPVKKKTSTGKERRLSAGETAGAVMGFSAAASRDRVVDQLLSVFGRVLLQPHALKDRLAWGDEEATVGRDEATRKRNLVRNLVLATMHT